MKRALLVMLAACSAAPRTTQPVRHAPTDTSPGLVVLVIVDQFPEWSLERKRTELTHGFARILGEGDWRVGRHPSAATITAPGHTLLGTGRTPDASGIIANEWWNRELNKKQKASEDENGQTSSKWLRVPGLGDAVAAAHTGAKAVAVALKNRAARLPLGHAGTAIYYDAKTASFASNGNPTPWLATYNREHPVGPRLVPWVPLDPVRLEKLSGVPDAQKGEVGEKGFGPTFPHDPNTTKNAADAAYAMPLGNDLVLETALAAIDNEKLGDDRTVDLLIVSLSSHDYIAHGWGHESWETWDS
ncbi:MAG TPA: alkaline phosphatase family protein, partial [Kofleriaceae bacterium]|nr:alkaline phosphatase family protein [Kofleriaceae bacterium]